MTPIAGRSMLRCGGFRMPEHENERWHQKFLPAKAPPVTLPPVWASSDERAMAQPCTPTTISVVDRGADEEGTAKEHTSVEAVNEDRSVEPVNEDRSVEPVNEDRSMKMTHKCMAWGEAEVAKAKTTVVPETTTAEVPETATTKAMTTKAHCRCCSRVWHMDGRHTSRASPAFRKGQGGECNGRDYKLMLEHWTSPCAATRPRSRGSWRDRTGM
jgi:hypothetical protein